MPRTDDARSQLARGGVALAVALAAANLCGYAFNVGATRLLGPRSYGALGALLGLVLIYNVAALGLQAVVARRLAVTDPASRTRVFGQVVRDGLAVALGVGLLALVLAPATAQWLHLPSSAPALLLAGAMVPLTALGVLQGVLQGTERFGSLGLMYVVAALGKVGGGLLGVVVERSVTGAMVGLLVGSAAAAAGCWLWLRPPLVRAGGGQLFAETAHATHAFLALFVLTNVDVLLARHYLPERTAGLYAAGAVIAKGAFWLPQFVPVLAFPLMADPARRRNVVRLSMFAVAGAGVVVTAVCWLFGDLVVLAVGGARYDDLAPEAWWFAALGACFACAQLLLYGRVAAEDRFAAVAVWTAAAVLAVVVAVDRNDTVVQIASTAVACAAVLVVVGMLTARRGAPTAEDAMPVMAEPTHP